MTARTEWLVIGRRWFVEEEWGKREGETRGEGPRGSASHPSDEAEPRPGAFPSGAWGRECFQFEFRISILEFHISTFDPQPITNGTIANRKACSVKYPKNAQAQIITTKRNGPIATPRLRILLFMYNRIAQ